MDEFCRGCRYYRAYYQVNTMCHYILDEGRKRPCDPGKGCTVYTPKAELKNSLEKFGKDPQKEENIVYTTSSNPP